MKNLKTSLSVKLLEEKKSHNQINYKGKYNSKFIINFLVN